MVFTLEGGNADFPAGTSGAEFEKGNGTGGYILVDHEPGVRAASLLHYSIPMRIDMSPFDDELELDGQRLSERWWFA